MSVYVFLKGSEVSKIEGFESKSKEKSFTVADRFRLPIGVYLFYKEGRWYFELDEPTDPIPSAFVSIVEEISFREYPRVSFKREAGIYKYGSAEAEVELPGGDGKFMIKIKSKNMKDLLDLYRKIRTGSIRPKQSYEREQISAPLSFFQKLKEKAESFFKM